MGTALFLVISSPQWLLHGRPSPETEGVCPGEPLKFSRRADVYVVAGAQLLAVILRGVASGSRLAAGASFVPSPGAASGALVRYCHCLNSRAGPLARLEISAIEPQHSFYLTRALAFSVSDEH
jgi:hypothetical protein